MDFQCAGSDNLIGPITTWLLQVSDKEQIFMMTVSAGCAVNAGRLVPLQVAHRSLTCPRVYETSIHVERPAVNGDELVSAACETTHDPL